MAIALVTGGSRGIGRATALLLAQEGYTVAVNYQQNLHCIDSLEVRKKPGGHWIIRDLMGLDLVGLASL